MDRIIKLFSVSTIIAGIPAFIALVVHGAYHRLIGIPITGVLGLSSDLVDKTQYKMVLYRFGGDAASQLVHSLPRPIPIALALALAYTLLAPAQLRQKTIGWVRRWSGPLVVAIAVIVAVPAGRVMADSVQARDLLRRAAAVPPFDIDAHGTLWPRLVCASRPTSDDVLAGYLQEKCSELHYQNPKIATDAINGTFQTQCWLSLAVAIGAVIALLSAFQQPAGVVPVLGAVIMTALLLFEVTALANFYGTTRFVQPTHLLRVKSGNVERWGIIACEHGETDAFLSFGSGQIESVDAKNVISAGTSGEARTIIGWVVKLKAAAFDPTQIVRDASHN